MNLLWMGFFEGMRADGVFSPEKFYRQYKQVILFNKNIIIAGIVSIIADALVVQNATISIDSKVILSILSIVTDTSVYLILFTTLFF